jgi:hypothetical protein
VRTGARAQRELLGDVRPVEVERVVAALAVDGVARIAGVPDEVVVTAAELRLVVPAAARDDVVAE